jgi:endonuclease/exonuclease/phosphatase (EEP) superfamily protein YafD
MWKHFIIALCVVLASTVVVLTCLPFVRSGYWWIRVWDFPRLQIALLSVVVIATFLFVWKPKAPLHVLTLLAAAGTCVYQSILILPYTPLVRVQVADADGPHASDSSTVKILISNVLFDNRESSRLVALVKEYDPDLVLAVEADAWWTEQLAELAADRPHTVLVPAENEYGMLLYSRFPMSDVTVRELSKPDVPSIRANIELPSGTTFTFYGLHPPPPFPTVHETSTPRDAELIIVAREVELVDGAIVVAGDLNDVAWSHTSRVFQRISGLRDPRVGRGLYNSFHADYFFARWPLDHVFLSEDFRLLRMQRLPTIGSDHFPIFVEAVLAGTDDPETAEPGLPDADDREDAEEILEEHRESSD